MKSKFLESPKIVLLLTLLAVSKAAEFSCEGIHVGTLSDQEALEKVKAQLVGSTDITVNEE
jgi:hypothetical protein